MFIVQTAKYNSLIGREGSSKSEMDDRTIPSNPEAPPVSSTEDNNNNNNNNPEMTIATLPHPPHKDMRHPMHHMGGHHPMYPDVMNGSKGPFCHYGPEFPPVMLAHIYQEELLKLIGKWAILALIIFNFKLVYKKYIFLVGDYKLISANRVRLLYIECKFKLKVVLYTYAFNGNCVLIRLCSFPL